jgi:formate dehydrogenase iron-sulfur subunit
MPLPLHELAQDPTNDPNRSIVRLTENGIEFFPASPQVEVKTTLIPDRPLEPGEQYRFHFDMTKCIGCRSCEVACNEQNNTPADLRWRRIGEIEGGTWPNTDRYYLSMGCNHCLSADCIKGCPVDAYTKDPHRHRPSFRGRLHRLSVLRLELPLLRAAIQPGARRRRQV